MDDGRTVQRDAEVQPPALPGEPGGSAAFDTLSPEKMAEDAGRLLEEYAADYARMAE